MGGARGITKTGKPPEGALARNRTVANSSRNGTSREKIFSPLTVRSTAPINPPARLTGIEALQPTRT